MCCRTDFLVRMCLPGGSCACMLFACSDIGRLCGQDLAEEEFDTTIQGPWMRKWEIVHMNKHVDRFLSQEAATRHAPASTWKSATWQSSTRLLGPYIVYTIWLYRYKRGILHCNGCQNVFLTIHVYFIDSFCVVQFVMVPSNSTLTPLSVQFFFEHIFNLHCTFIYEYE